ncbi:hypothetical protein GE061_001054 [Apolygus lucorum]|uniref:Uncharacterized protein n=1 Tax=Apolygus lucorum TaxID=248454 RepID=A0A8S9Y8C8_APOLU|nr:hypothetical protein GE061_001054 [Apolygus lucorum]
MDEMVRKVVEPLIRANKDMAMELSHHRRVALGVENISVSVQSLDEAFREMKEGRGEVASERLVNEPSNMEMATALDRLESALCEKLDKVLARIDRVERSADKAVSQVESLKREEMVAIGRKIDVLNKRAKEGEIKKPQPVVTPREGGSHLCCNGKRPCTLASEGYQPERSKGHNSLASGVNGELSH